MSCVICPDTANEDKGVNDKVKVGQSDVFMRPILYITAFVLIVILISVVGFIYNMDEQKDPLIYSKFLTSKKNK